MKVRVGIYYPVVRKEELDIIIDVPVEEPGEVEEYLENNELSITNAHINLREVNRQFSLFDFGINMKEILEEENSNEDSCPSRV